MFPIKHRHGYCNLSWSLQRGSLRTMSQSWRCSQAGEWTRTAASTSGRTMQNMNFSGSRWWVCNHVFSPFYFCYDPVHLHYRNHWWVYFIIVGFFPRSHGFHIPWNEWDRGSFPAHTGTISLWCSFIPRLAIRRLLFDVKISSPSFSTPCRRSSSPAAVQRSMVTSMSKNWAGSLGRSPTSFYGGQGFISPTRELPRLEETNTFLKRIVNQKRCRQTDDSFILISIYPVNIQAGEIHGLTGKS